MTRLGRLLLFASLIVGALIGAALFVATERPGALVPIDAYAYWDSWRAGLYSAHGVLWGTGFVYSPAFAQVIWPLTLLPWPLFAALWFGATAATYTWLLWPLEWPIRIAGFAFLAAAVIPPGNIEWLFALVALALVRWPAVGALPLLTKIAPGIAVAWFALRREWRSVGIALAATAVVVLASLILAPVFWQGWIEVLVRELRHGRTELLGGFLPGPPLSVRVLAALALLVWAAPRGRKWAIPAAMALAEPGFALGSLGILAALPRMYAVKTAAGDPRLARGGSVTGRRLQLASLRSAPSLREVAAKRPRHRA